MESANVASSLLRPLQLLLQNATAPLTLSEVARGLKRPAKMKVPEFQAQLRTLLEDEIRQGRAFSYPSGAKGAVRYWARDEKHFLREKALELAETPLAIPTFAKSLKPFDKGVAPGFVEAVIREMIGDDLLFEYSPAKKGPPLFGASPPPPPPPVLQRPVHRKKLEKLLADCRKLLADSGSPVAELLSTLQERLAPEVPEAEVAFGSPTVEKPVDPQSATRLEERILKAIENVPVLSLAKLRRDMPPEWQGAAFDEAVLRLADERRVIVGQDAHPGRFSPEEMAEFVPDGDGFLTTISKGE